MSSLLRLSRLIDWINERVGRSVMWLVLIAVVISAGNALVRKLFNTSSNALLEIQWYLFAAIFMLAAGYTFLRNEHVRIDILTSRLSPRGQNIVDVIGMLFFLLPMAGLSVALSWRVPGARRSAVSPPTVSAGAALATVILQVWVLAASFGVGATWVV